MILKLLLGLLVASVVFGLCWSIAAINKRFPGLKVVVVVGVFAVIFGYAAFQMLLAIGEAAYLVFFV